MVYIIRLFSKRKKHLPFFANAVAEGIKDAFREMGYPVTRD
jgi:hypothetical protein